MDHSWYDKRGYPIVGAEAGYDEWSATYENVVQDEMDLRLFNQIETVDWAVADCILDLACGTGRVGAWLRERTDAAIDGVDISTGMMAQARAKHVYGSVTAADITRTGLPADAYDICTQSLADEHLGDLAPLYQEVARLTKPGGCFVLVGYHPFFLMLGMPTHFDRASGESITIRSYVHLFSHHVRAAQAAGWSLAEMHEALIDEAWLRVKPKWEQHVGQPISFALVWRR